MRALNALISHDWAMQPEYLRTMMEVAAREHAGLKAVEALRGERLEYSYAVTVRDGVAVIPVSGPICRYMNFISYYSGGTSVQMLARDFNAALNDSRIDSILFEINSPGGEVTGINELANMIFAARGRKPMVARVGGLGASAAYWLAAAVGDIVCDETAQLGSIGVYCAYLDAKKADEKLGVREIVIKSSQSPKKALDPSTPEGEQAIQARIDALASVFIDSVARFRDVETSTVMQEFGQGDVLVGQSAVDAGLADRLGSFEETISALVKAHGRADGRNYTGALDDVSAELEKAEEEGASEMAIESEKEVVAGDDQAGLEELKARLAEAAQRAEEREEVLRVQEQRVAALETQARTMRLSSIAASFTGDRAGQMQVLEHLAVSAGEESEVFKSYVQQQLAVAEQLRQSELFKEKGEPDAATEGDAFAQLEAAAKQIAAADGGTVEQAFEAACERNPELYRRYSEEARG